MITVILAGGLGTRLAEETEVRPKPMIEIGGRPILWHIMKLYGHRGFREFAIALGYKGEAIKRFFVDYTHTTSDLVVSTASGEVVRQRSEADDWKVHLRDTGQSTMTGGRIRRLADLLRGGTFMATYGDGLSNVDMRALLEFHRKHGKLATLTAVRPPARYGALEFDGDSITRFAEKPQVAEGWINGGFFVLEPGVLDYIDGDGTHFEREPLERLARDGQLMAYRHQDFWQSMDTLRDHRYLNGLWESGSAPWRLWE